MNHHQMAITRTSLKWIVMQLLHFSYKLHIGLYLLFVSLHLHGYVLRFSHSSSLAFHNVKLMSYYQKVYFMRIPSIFK